MAVKDDPWRVFRVRRRVLWLVFACYLPVVVLVSAIAKAAELPESLVVGCAAAWLSLWLAVSLWDGLLRCPCCGKRFYMSGVWSNPFTSKCLHCGARKWGRRGK